ncbi:MAG: hypothetical protein M0010_13130 [Actinomycetota bacterium]|jgi:hypothetical protein|nr:hypothetical protein [Actinomycetota bacterium]
MFSNSLYRKGLLKVPIGVALVVYGIVGGPDSRVSLLVGAALLVWGAARLRGGFPSDTGKGSQWR